ncbi:MAG: trypsin-like peptidase domain-containing protein [Clostridia bacterium]|nr:trypsin-like peptidase domain-containing protein [Clostridia bacterium]
MLQDNENDRNEPLNETPAEPDGQGNGANVDGAPRYDAAGRKKSRKGILIGVCSVLAVTLLAFAGLGISGMIPGGKGSGAVNIAKSTSSSSSGTPVTSSKQATVKSVAAELSLEAIAKKVEPSIVGIVTYSLSQVGELAEGSGIIMSADGYILTNDHVISGADKYQVVLSNGKKYDAKRIGADARSDLAVLKINATGLTVATFGDSSQLEVGDTVVAIGNPGGLEFADSVTKGIVSALNRSVTSSTGYSMKYIQTDAAINPGNSGGALVNVYGQVVGISTAKIADVDYEGIGFAIPIDSAKTVVDDLIKYGYVTNRVKLGISCEALDAYAAKLYNVPTGLLVAAVDSSSDAAARGIQQNDIITEADGKALSSVSDLLNAEYNYKAGESITLTIYRASNGSGKTFTVKVKLMADNGTTTASSSSSSSTQQYYSSQQSGSGF